MSLIKLCAGKTVLTLSPDHGAAILNFAHDGQDMFKPVEDGWRDDYDPIKTSCFPLVPYSNRIRDGKFQFEGKDISIHPLYTRHDNALHGVGWVRPWIVSQQSTDRCECVYSHNADQWPWDFTAIQTLALKDGSLELSLSITNESETNMPAGLGPHPYFPNKDNAELQFSAMQLWKNDAEDLPTELIDLPPEWDFNASKALRDICLDNCYSQLGSGANIRWANERYGMHISAPPGLGFAVVYVPEARNYFCFEPVTHMNDAVNWDGKGVMTGLKTLKPAETLSVTIEFIVTE